MINESKDSANEVIRKTSDLIDEVTKQINALQHTFDDWFKKMDETTKNLFKDYQALWDKHNKEVEKLIKQHKELSKETSKLVEYLNTVNFPARLDKIDSTIASCLTGIQNIQSQLNSISDELLKTIKDADEGLNKSLRNLETKLSEEFKDQIMKLKKTNKIQFIIIVLAVGLSLAGIVVSFFYK